MQNCTIKIRQSNINDMLDIWKWRNDPQTKLMSRSMQEDIAWNFHTEWYMHLLENKNSLI